MHSTTKFATCMNTIFSIMNDQSIIAKSRYSYERYDPRFLKRYVKPQQSNKLNNDILTKV